jgi:hypothetical protein
MLSPKRERQPQNHISMLWDEYTRGMRKVTSSPGQPPDLTQRDSVPRRRRIKSVFLNIPSDAGFQPPFPG